MSESSARGPLQRRYEAMRRWWCTGEGEARDHLGLAVLRHQGMRVWMRQPAHAESREAAVREALAPPRATGRGSDAVASPPLHAEIARLLAAMAIGTIAAKEQTA